MENIPQDLEQADLLRRYQKVAQRLWELFPNDPLSANNPAHLWIDKAEALQDLTVVAIYDGNTREFKELLLVMTLDEGLIEAKKK